MYKAKVDVAVLLIFFNRPQVLKQTFEQIKKARPSKLFLCQDGQRLNKPDDIETIKECRKIVDDIDWECEVKKLYRKTNLGCDPNHFLAQKWAFSFVDKCIIIEDDIVAEVSFFRYCKELLDKYQYDDRIARICGMNHLGKYKANKSDYFFTNSGSVWGWATWKRVIDNLDSTYSFLNDIEKLKIVKNNCKNFGLNYNNFINTCKWHKSTNKEFFESIHTSYRLLNNSLSIVPSLNQISNIGITQDSVHANSNLKSYPHGLRRVFFMQTFPLLFPLKHPTSISNDIHYSKKVMKIMGISFFVKKYRMFEMETRYQIQRVRRLINKILKLN